MAKYKLECYGWEIVARGLSLTAEQVENIHKLLEEGFDNILEARDELEYIDVDINNPNLFFFSKPLNNARLVFSVRNDAGKKIATFGLKEMSYIYDVMEDFEEKYNDNSFTTIPEKGGNERTLLCVDKNKGELFYMEFESEEVPIAKDFAYSGNDIETPDGDWDYINRIFFKKQELEVTEYLDPEEDDNVYKLWTLDNI